MALESPDHTPIKKEDLPLTFKIFIWKRRKNKITNLSKADNPFHMFRDPNKKYSVDGDITIKNKKNQSINTQTGAEWLFNTSESGTHLGIFETGLMIKMTKKTNKTILLEEASEEDIQIYEKAKAVRKAAAEAEKKKLEEEEKNKEEARKEKAMREAMIDAMSDGDREEFNKKSEKEKEEYFENNKKEKETNRGRGRGRDRGRGRGNDNEMLLFKTNLRF